MEWQRKAAHCLCAYVTLPENRIIGAGEPFRSAGNPTRVFDKSKHYLWSILRTECDLDPNPVEG